MNPILTVYAGCSIAALATVFDRSFFTAAYSGTCKTSGRKDVNRTLETKGKGSRRHRHPVAGGGVPVVRSKVGAVIDNHSVFDLTPNPECVGICCREDGATS